MATLIQSYEQQYSILTADITAKIGRLKVASEDDRDRLSKEIQSNFEEANDLLEQLELEYQGAGAGSRVAAYRAELQRVKEEYRSVTTNSENYNVDPEEYDDWSANDQRRQLLDNSERLERTGRTLAAGHRAALDAERTGAAVLVDLHGQREGIQRARGRLRETDATLNRSSRLAGLMATRALRDRLALGAVLLAVAALLAVGVVLYAR